MAAKDPRNRGRTGRPWRRTRARMIQLWRQDDAPCWLCGQPIDWDLPAQHPMAATVDHLDPLSLGGAPLDTTRMAPAHMGCNARRGNSTTHTTAARTLPRSRRW